MKIFILDDEHDSDAQMESYIRIFAHEMGLSMETRGSEDPDEFLQEYEQCEEKPYLVIIRVEMQKMSGMEVARTLRQRGSSV